MDFTQSILMLGFLIGSLIFGQISDTYGRQAPLLAGSTNSIIFWNKLASNKQNKHNVCVPSERLIVKSQVFSL